MTWVPVLAALTAAVAVVCGVASPRWQRVLFLPVMVGATVLALVAGAMLGVLIQNGRLLPAVVGALMIVFCLVTWVNLANGRRER